MREGRLLPFQGSRLILTRVIMLCTLLVLVLRLYQYQFIDHQKFSDAADENAISKVPLAAPRGVIYDRYGVPLALNAAAWLVTITPAGLPDDQATALNVLNRLSALIEVPPTRAAADAAGLKDVRSLQEMVVEGAGIAPYRAVIVKANIPQPIAQQILEDKSQLPGIDVQWGAVREYPNGMVTAQIIGYLGPIGQKEANSLRDQGYNPSFERTGYAGIEAALNVQLSGTRGSLVQKVDVAGRPVQGGLLKEDPAIAGENVRLTIDLALQEAAQNALIDQINRINTKKKQLQSQAGAVVAIDPRNGQILAMVSWPTYDNSKFARFIDGNYYTQVAKDPLFPLVNRAVGSLYPPGSTWKILTSVAVAQEHVIDPNSNLNDSGQLIVSNSFAPNDQARSQKFVCWKRTGHGEVNLIKAIAVSCDVYFYQVGGGNPAVSPQTLRPGGLGVVNLDRYAAMFGVGEQTFIEIPGAVAGRMPDPTWKRRYYGESWSTGDTYNAAFGQGYVTVSPLQLANVAATIANGGTQYQPTLIDSFVDSANNVVQPFQPHVLRTMMLPTDGSPAVLHIEEDMRIKGQNSLACVCELDSGFYDPANVPDALAKRVQDPANPDDPKATIVQGCDPAKVASGYRQTVIVDRDMTPPSTPGKHFNFQSVDYTVFVPFDYDFTDGVCDKDQFNVADASQFASPKPDAGQNGYQPPFVDSSIFTLVQTGMHDATQLGGTVGADSVQGDPIGYNLSNGIPTAGKTGTAEYCDDVAFKSNLCQQGAWPAHAWFVGYAPYNAPEIAIAAFVYHGDEGSAYAMPVVRAVTECYFSLKAQRAKGVVNPACNVKNTNSVVGK